MSSDFGGFMVLQLQPHSLLHTWTLNAATSFHTYLSEMAQDETLRRRRLEAASTPEEPLEELVAEPARAAVAGLKKDD